MKNKIDDLLSKLEDINSKPEFLYHYTNSTTAIEYILANNTLKFSPLTQTNDPLEFASLTHVGTSVAGSNGFKEALKHGNKLENIRNKVKLLCLCQDFNNGTQYPFYKGYCKPRMWSQYGEKHKGICIVFSKERLLELIEAKYPNNCLYDDVTYDNKLIKLKKALVIDESEIETTAEERLKKHASGYIFSKLEDYRDENEFRIALFSENYNKTDSVYIDILDHVEAIIVGDLFPDVYLPSIKKLSTEQNFEIFRLWWTNGHPILENLEEGT